MQDRKKSVLVMWLVMCWIFSLCPATTSSGAEMILEVRNQYPSHLLPSGFKVAPEGDLVASNGYSITRETYYCRDSSDGYLIETGDKNWATLIGRQPEFLGDKVIARYKDERLFRFSNDSPIQYTSTFDLMTNVLKNGFLPMEQEASSILNITNLGIDDMFEREQKLNSSLHLHLRLRTFPDIQCLGTLVLTNGVPLSLAIIFTNHFKDVMLYDYTYSKTSNLKDLSYDAIILIVRNVTQGKTTYSRDVRIVLFHNEIAFSNRSDFGFNIKVPEKKYWIWQADKINGMDEKIANAAKGGEYDQFVERRGMVLSVRIIIISFAILPFVIWGVSKLLTKGN